jgi:rod shape-determining protein MreC
MPLGTLDRTPPPFFKQGPSALSKLMVFSALAIFLMVADTRFKIVQPIRAVLGTLLFPVQWLALQPVVVAEGVGEYAESVRGAQAAQAIEAQARAKLAQQSVRIHQVEQLTLENARLRKLLDLRERVTTPAQAAQVLYEAADVYSRKVILDKGMIHGIESGSPVIDEFGVLGQITRVYPAVSEVTLVTDRDQATPVLNARTGARSVAHGDTSGLHPGLLELRFMAANADVQAGDLLTTSGVDGVYPPGLPVAQIEKIERRADSAFARIHLAPRAAVTGALHVMVLKPVGEQLPPRPAAEASAPAPVKPGGRK